MTRHTHFILAAALLCASISACAREVATLPTDLAVAGRANATPSLAAAGSFVAVAWGATAGGVTDVFLAVSRDGGRSFASLTRVNDDASAANLAGEQPPQVALMPNAGGDPSIVIVWTTKSAEGTRLTSARSDDGGVTFTAPVVVPGSEAAGNRGWQSIAVDGSGRVLAVWLDHRDGAMATTTNATAAPTHVHEGHDAGAPMDGVARAQRSQIFFGSLDGAVVARGLTAGVCYCCKTALTVGADGAIYAAWRHVYEGNVRDIAFSASRDGGRTFAAPVRVSEDKWVLDGCPENGPALAVDADNRIHAVWPTLVPSDTPGGEPTMSLFYATSTDGRTFSPRQRIPTENVPRHPQIAVDEDGTGHGGVGRTGQRRPPRGNRARAEDVIQHHAVHARSGWYGGQLLSGIRGERRRHRRGGDVRPAGPLSDSRRATRALAGAGGHQTRPLADADASDKRGFAAAVGSEHGNLTLGD